MRCKQQETIDSKGFLCYTDPTMQTTYTPRPPYPPDWVEIAEEARRLTQHKCAACGMQGLTPELYDVWDTPENRPLMLEVHHVDGDPANCDCANLSPLCKACHLDAHRRMREKRKREAERAAGQTQLTI
ncbi:MAG: HNH endonuclease signature motif containing protein [Anaerovoracaceae bacterium]